MPGSVTSVFSEPDDFQAMLREEGVLGMLITGRGRFRARLTQIMLHRLRLVAAEERLARIAFIAVPADAVLVALPIGSRSSPIWGGIGMRTGGIGMRTGEIITLGPDQRVGLITHDRIRRGVFTSVPELEAAIHDYLDHHNAHPKPFVWTKSAEEILAKVSRARRTREIVAQGNQVINSVD